FLRPVAFVALLLVVRLERQRDLLSMAQSQGTGLSRRSKASTLCVAFRPNSVGLLNRFEVFRRGLPALWIALLFVGNLLALFKALQAGALDGRDMDKNIRAAVVRLNETETLSAVEPLHGADWHDVLHGGAAPHRMRGASSCASNGGNS